MKIITHHFGVRFGHFTDKYEIACAGIPEAAIQRFIDWFSRKGYRVSGRAFDGAFIFPVSPRHEVAVYFKDHRIEIEDRFQTRIWLRLAPSRLRRQLPEIVAALTKETIDAVLKPEQ